MIESPSVRENRLISNSLVFLRNIRVQFDTITALNTVDIGIGYNTSSEPNPSGLALRWDLGEQWSENRRAASYEPILPTPARGRTNYMIITSTRAPALEPKTNFTSWWQLIRP